MKEYLVWSKIDENKWIVSAKNAKDAIQQVYDKYEDLFIEEDLKSRSLESLHCEYGKIICV